MQLNWPYRIHRRNAGLWFFKSKILLELIEYQNHLSKAVKTVNWEHGHDENLINLKYANFIEGTLIPKLDQVKIDL